MPSVFLTEKEWQNSPLKERAKKTESGLYQVDLGANEFFVDTEDPSKLKSALEASRREKDAAALELKQLKERMDGVDSEAAKKAAEAAATAQLELEQSIVKNKDMQAMLDQFKQQSDAQNAQFQQQLEARDEKLANEKKASDAAIVEANAKAFCAKHFGDDTGTLSPLLIPRLRNGVGNQLEAVDEQGNQMSMEDFQKEVLANKVLAPIIEASKGSGVGDTRGISSPVDIGDKTLDQLDSDEQMALFKNNPEQFKQLQDAAATPANFDKPGSML